MNPEIHESKYQMTSFKKMPGKRANPGEKQPLEFTFDPPVNGIKRAKGTGSTDTGNSRFTFSVSLYPEGSDKPLKKRLTQHVRVNHANPETWDGAVHAEGVKSQLVAKIQAISDNDGGVLSMPR